MVMLEKTERYVYTVGNRKINLDKEMTDRYSELVCPVDGEYVEYMIKIFDGDNCNDSVLSYRISLDMARELAGYER